MSNSKRKKKPQRPTAGPQPAAPTNQPPRETATDPHRHARLFRAVHCEDSKRRKTLRFWRGEWWRWADGQYRLVSLSDLKAQLSHAMKELIDLRRIMTRQQYAVAVTTGLINNVLGVLAGMVRVGEDVEQPTWLAPNAMTNECLAAANGIVSLAHATEGTLQPHTPEWFSPSCVPYAFDPTARCPMWEQFLDKVLEGDVERIHILQEWFGLLLTPDTTFQKFLVLEGEGANGKSVVLEILEAMLGRENVSHVPLEVFGQRFQLGMTLHKLANLAPEVNEHAKLDEGVIKQFVGGDVLYVDRKGINGISAKPTARLVVATNSRPKIGDRTYGMWRRMELLPFQVTIPPAEQDHQLAAKLKTELPGILNWALTGRRRLHAQSRFTTSAIANAALNEYREQSNPARQFLSEHCHLDPSVNTSVERVYSRYVHWSKMNGHTPIGNAQFGKELKKLYPSVERKRASSGSRPWAYAGLVVDDGDEPNAYHVDVERDAA
jgi:P4 family phage/plasmid primase-like protien